MEFGNVNQTTRLPVGKLANTGHVNRAIDAANANRHFMHHGQAEGRRMVGAIIPVRPVSLLATGKYNGKTFGGGVHTSVTTAIGATQIGDEAPAVDAIMWNVAEVAGGAALDAGPSSAPVMCKVLAADDATGKIVVVVLGGAGGGDSKGKYQGQVHTMLTDLQDGWDFVKVHGGAP